MLEVLIENKDVIVMIACLVVAIAVAVVTFAKYPTSKKLEVIKSWILVAVTTAEKELGSGTGAIKLAIVYSAFVDKFPVVGKVLSYEKFEEYVEEALVKMREALGQN